jgi:peroxiredoxin
MVRLHPSITTLAFALASVLVLSSACTERARPSDFDSKSAQPTAESTAKLAEPEAREPDSVKYSDNGPAPELKTVKFFANTRGMYLQDLRGKYVMLHLFTITEDSVANRKLVKRYNEMYRSLLNKGNFQMLGVITGGTVKNGQQLLEAANRNQIGFPVALDATGAVAQDYKAASFPATYLVDPEGNIIFTRAGAGGTDYAENAVRQKLGLPLIPERD